MIRNALDGVMRRRARLLCRWLRPHLPAYGPMLDVGSGTGHNGLEIEKQTGFPVVDADVVNMSAVGRPVVCYDGHQLPFRDQSFSCATLLFALHYVQSPAQLLCELRRVTSLRLLVLQSTYRGNWGSCVLRCRELVQGRTAFHVARCARYVPKTECSLHPRRYFTRDELSPLFALAGWQLCGVESHPWPGMGVSRDLFILEPLRRKGVSQ